MAQKLSDKRLAVLGAGKLGGIFAARVFEAGAVCGETRDGDGEARRKAKALAKELGVSATNDNRKAVKDADIILLGEAASRRRCAPRIAPELSEKTLVISVAASVADSYSKSAWSRSARCARCRTRLSAVGAGMTGICAGAHAKPDIWKLR